MEKRKLFLLKFADVIFIGLIALNTFLGLQNVMKDIYTDNLMNSGLMTRATEWASDIHIADCKFDKTIDERRPQGCSPEGAGRVISVKQLCDYNSDIDNIVVNVVWAVYYGVLLSVRVGFTSKYDFNDWRYVLASDQFNASKKSMAMFAVGVILTLICFSMALDALRSKEAGDSGEIWSLIMWVILNTIGLYFSATLCKNKSNKWMDDFKEPMPITKVPGGDGFLNILMKTWSINVLLNETVLEIHLGKGNELSDGSGAALQSLVKILAESDGDEKRVHPN